MLSHSIVYISLCYNIFYVRVLKSYRLECDVASGRGLRVYPRASKAHSLFVLVSVVGRLLSSAALRSCSIRTTCHHC